VNKAGAKGAKGSLRRKGDLRKGTRRKIPFCLGTQPAKGEGHPRRFRGKKRKGSTGKTLIKGTDTRPRRRNEEKNTGAKKFKQVR